LVFAVLFARAGGDPAGDSKVVELTGADFDEQVGRGEGTPWFVKFYAPWCGHCKSMAPMWKELANKLDGKVRFAKVDAVRHHWLMEVWDVESFPTLKLIAKGKAYTFEGQRSPRSLEAWALGGYHGAKGEVLPMDRPFHERVMKILYSYAWTYGMPLACIASVAYSVWTCWSLWGERPTAEEIEKRRVFEERLAAAERRLAEKHAQKQHGQAPQAGGEAVEPAVDRVVEGEGEAGREAAAGPEVAEKADGEKKND